MTSNGSDLQSQVTESNLNDSGFINDKWTVEDLKPYLRRRGRVSGKKAALIERYP